MEDEVFLYCEEHNDSDIDVLINQFGSPEEVANEFLAELGISTINKSNQMKRRVLFLAAIIVITAIALVSATEIYTRYKQQQVLDGYYIDSITYEGDITPYISGPTYSADYFSNEENGSAIPQN